MADKNSPNKKATKNYSKEQLQARKDSVRAIKEFYGDQATPRVINSILGNIEVETSFKDLKEGQYSWKNLQENPNLKTVRENVAKWGKGKEGYEKLSHDEKLSVMYWGDTDHKETAGGRGSIQLTSAGYGGNQKTDEDLKVAAKELGMDLGEVHSDFYNSTLATLQVFKNRGKDFIDYADSPLELRKKVINSRETLDPKNEHDVAKINSLSYYDSDKLLFSNDAESKGAVSINPEEIKNNPNLDDAAKEEALRVNESQGLEPETAARMQGNGASLGTSMLDQYSGNNANSLDLNSFLMTDDQMAKQRKVDQARKQAMQFTGDTGSFASDYNLLEDKSLAKGGSMDPPNDLKKRREAATMAGRYNGVSDKKKFLSGIEDEGMRSLVKQYGEMDGKSRLQEEQYLYGEVLKDEGKWSAEPLRYAADQFGGTAKDITNQLFSTSFDKGGRLDARSQMNEVTEYDEGGSHEENPNGGVAVGQNSSGGLNLIEEGETRHGDYIFSNDFKLSKEDAERFKLDPKYVGEKYSDVSRKFNDEIKARPYDRITKQTAKGNLSKLMMAQEAVKVKEGDNEMMQPQQANQFMVGGDLDPAKKKSAFGEMSGIEKAGAITGAAGTALSLGTKMFDSGIDTTGADGRQEVGSRGGAAASGAIQGAAAGAQFGLVGAGIGAAVGGITGLIGGDKAKRDAAEATNNAALVENLQHTSTFARGGSLIRNTGLGNSQFHKGGGLHDHPHTDKEKANTYTGEYPRLVTDLDQFSKRDRHHGLNPDARNNDFYVDRNGNIVSSVPKGGAAPRTNHRLGLEIDQPQNKDGFRIPYNVTDQERAINGIIEGNTSPIISDNKETKSGYKDTPYTGGDLIDKEAIEKLVNPTSLSEYEQDAAQQERRSFLDDQEAYSNSNITRNKDWQLPDEDSDEVKRNEFKERGFQAQEALRYAPVLGSALGLLNLDDANKVRYDRLDNRYKEQQVDERSLENRVANSAANTRQLLANYANGSESAARANILGSQVNESTSLSNAMAEAQEMNRQDNRAGQQFNTAIDQQNQNIGMQEMIANEQNESARTNRKNMLTQNIYNDLGNIGMEQQQTRSLYNLSGGYGPDGRKNTNSLIDSIKGIYKKKNTENAEGGLLDVARQLFDR